MASIRRMILLLALLAFIAAPAVAAKTEADVDAMIAALTLGAATAADELWNLVDRDHLTPTDRGEMETLRSAFDDPLGLLEFPTIPTDILADLTIFQIGPIVGPHVLDISPDTTLAAVALGDPHSPISAEKLRSFQERASVRQEDAAAQAADLAALLGH